MKYYKVEKNELIDLLFSRMLLNAITKEEKLEKKDITGYLNHNSSISETDLEVVVSSVINERLKEYEEHEKYEEMEKIICQN